MFFALDKNGDRVYAEDGVFSDCVCPACRMPVIQKKGEYKRHHFAHKRKASACPFENNGDYKNMSEWHIRMQDYFPKEAREHIFLDKQTGTKHIADVYLKEKETVLEFQHSPIKKEEFLARTSFHLNEGRRIVWLFDESWKDNADISTKQYYKNGKLVKNNSKKERGPYSEKSYNWLYRRRCIEDGPDINQPSYCVSVYTGAEGDVFHKIVFLDGSDVIISLHDFTISDEINVDEFFYNEDHWKEQEPWKSVFALYEEQNHKGIDIKQIIAKERESRQTGSFGYTKLPKDFSEWSEEQQQRYLSYEDIDIRMKKIREQA